MSLCLKILEISDKLEGINNLIVVKQHASDLASTLAVHSLDNGIDSISDLLSALLRFLDLAKLVKVDKSRSLRSLHD